MLGRWLRAVLVLRFWVAVPVPGLRFVRVRVRVRYLCLDLGLSGLVGWLVGVRAIVRVTVTVRVWD